MTGLLFDWLAFPRFAFGSLPWWGWLAVSGVLLFVAGGVRAALRMVLLLAAVMVGVAIAVGSWLDGHPEITQGSVEVVETVGGVR